LKDSALGRLKSARKVRIIGGQWRRRQLYFEPTAGLRPTGDRIREQLFNWIGPLLEDTHCIDLFAGSGALAFEALSRGARSCLAIEHDPTAAQWLRYNAQQLGACQLQVLHADCLRVLTQTPTQKADIVFIDPPFAMKFTQNVCQKLEYHGWLTATANVYCELAAESAPLQIPPNWQLKRQKISGNVDSRVYTRIEPRE